MRDERPRSSRLAATFIALGVSLAAGGIAFNLWMLRVQELPPSGSGDIKPKTAIEVLGLMSSTLGGAFILAIAFIVGSFVMVRIGRHFLDRTPSLPRTEYVDAWGRYRISEDEIDAMTGGPKRSRDDEPDEDSDFESDDPLDDRPDRPRDDD